jgi:hypothetical protein
MKNLLVCIAFFYEKKRYEYLKNIIKNLLSYDLDLDIIIDTNSEDLFELVSLDFSREFNLKKIIIFNHKNLDNNFLLTWMHRHHFKNNILNYENFYYTEDDILLPFENYKSYILDFSKLWPNYIPSFVRMETDGKNFYHTDSYVKTKIHKNKIIKIQGELFVSIHNSYHGFWIMPQKTLVKCINEKFCQPIKSKKTREIAASFGLRIINLSLNNAEKYKYINNLLISNNIEKEGLLKLDNYSISKSCYCFHLPNNYIKDNKYNLAKIKINEIIIFDKYL